MTARAPLVYVYPVDATWSAGTSRRYHAAHPTESDFDEDSLVAACNPNRLALVENEWFRVDADWVQNSVCQRPACKKLIDAERSRLAKGAK